MFRAFSYFVNRSIARFWPGSLSSPRRRRARSQRVRLESLETRLVPAIHVTTLSDAEFHSGLSLRDAVHIANGIPNSTILFDVSGQISLTQHELILSANMTIDGSFRSIQISGSHDDRVFDIESTTPITGLHINLIALTLMDGQPHSGKSFHDGNGGGIYVNDPAASLTLVNDILMLNHAQGSGAAVYSRGPVTLVHTTIENNNSDGDGGGVWAAKPITLVQYSLVTDNQAGNDGGGLYETGTGTTVTVTDSEIQNNSAVTGQGGGIWAENNIALLGSSIHNNTARLDGGGIYTEDGNITVNSLSHVDKNISLEGNGGGIRAHFTVTISGSSTVSGNNANGSGGGIYSADSAVRVTGGSEVWGNIANGRSADPGNGGGIWAFYDVFVDNSAVLNNIANSNGGGIYAANGSVFITCQSDISGNTAVGSDWLSGAGGGIWASDDATVSSSTIASNRAGWDGGGIDSAIGNTYLNAAFVTANVAANDGGGIRDQNNVLVENNSLINLNFANHNGGGIFLTRFHSLLLDNSALQLNQAGNDGGGVYADRDGDPDAAECVTIIDSTFDRNSSGMNGAGLRTQDVENVSITFSTFVGNTAQSGTGGGIDVTGSNANVFIVNSTFGENTAQVEGGAIYAQGTPWILPRGIELPPAILMTINHVTFNDNISYGGDQSGSAIFVGESARGYLENTLVDDTNDLSFLLNTDLLSHRGGSLISMGHNLVVDHSFNRVAGFDATIGDLGGISQGLDPLANYGGNTFTYRLQAGPAVGGADNSGPYEDQRHMPRSFGAMDIGSYQTPRFTIALALPLH
ncbi:MAG TPA: right-handed parallel beta-helix repeat-containing protein [Gemmataceae bacterium]|nr:right-handed parallel beta-helix repeat-containing protein [Gemmataceae bacterium]